MKDSYTVLNEREVRSLKYIIHCFTGDHPSSWTQWISWAEFAYNTGFHSALKTTLFEVVYGRPAPCFSSCYHGLSRLKVVDCELQTRNQLLRGLRHRLLQAQQCIKQFYNAHHWEVTFNVDCFYISSFRKCRYRWSLIIIGVLSSNKVIWWSHA